MTDTLPSAAVGRELGGCPVMHRDFSRRAGRGMPLGAGRRAARVEPALLQHLRAGLLGVHALRRGPRHLQDTRTSSRARRSRRGSRTRSIGSSRRRSTRPTTSSTGASSTRGSRPARWTAPSRDCATSAAASSRTSPRRAACDFVTGFALRFPTEAFLSMIGVDPADADLFVPWVEDFFAGFGGDPDGVEPMAAALGGHPRVLGRRAGGAPRRARAARRATSPSTCSTRPYDERPLTDAEMLDMLTVLVLAGLDTTRAELGYMFRHLAAHPEHRQRLLVASRSSSRSAVEEVLRYYTIIFGDGRKVTRDVEFHGVELKKGDMVYGLVSGGQPRPARVRAGRRVRDRPQAQQPHGLRERPAPLPRHAPRPPRDADRGEEWLRVIPDFDVAAGEALVERGGGAMMTLTHAPARVGALRR